MMSAERGGPNTGEKRGSRALDPDRFKASRRVLWVDSFMNQFIKVGGLMVIVAVIGIFLFIVSQVVPLFQGAAVEELEIEEQSDSSLPAGHYVAIGADEWSELPNAVRDDGSLWFVDLVGERGVVEFPNAYLEGGQATAFDYQAATGGLAVGTDQGRVHLLKIGYEPVYEQSTRRVQETVEVEFSAAVSPGVPITRLGLGLSPEARLLCAESGTDGNRRLTAVVFARKRSLLGGEQWTDEGTIDLSGFLDEEDPLQNILVTNRADSLALVYQSGQVAYLVREGDEILLGQRFAPFADLGEGEREVALAGFVLGDVSLAFVSSGGVNRVFSLYRSEEEPVRKFYPTKEFPRFEGEQMAFSASTRNKTFLLAAGDRASLRHSTTESVRWESRLPFEVSAALIGRKYDSLIFLDRDARFHRYRVDDPHPEASFKALFGKVWYEGSSEPKYEWQSTGGSDDFEAKLSLMPLIFGSLKGTFYAMLFAVPIALFGALYTAEFLHPKHKAIVKPLMEVMASLPSVVLGFLAALWLAPLIEDRIPSILAVILIVPAGALLLGWLWSRQPKPVRKCIPDGLEFLAVAPFLAALAWLGWISGPAIEGLLFTVTDRETGNTIADFRRWWPEATGTPFEQRNSLVVGFMMGFAVIPIVFTIAEDSLSNVPGALRSGSYALGASRWQTAWRIVLPTASAGIFSALMIGLGRAVGETMIMVMATGNTPIMEWNILSGMRTLSANIAVELPEAPHHGTLYRTLFLGAVVLFLMTFLVNTVAEVLRQHLRERYKTI